MKLTTATALLCTLGCAASAQFGPPDPVATHSKSGQFIIFDPNPGAPRAALPELAGNANYLTLEPTLLAVSCERVKQTLWRELGVNDEWRGRIYLTLHPARSADEIITIVSESYRDGWNYRLELPDTVERARFIRALVNVLLLELAGRNSAARGAVEIPVWLSEGLTRQLLAVPGAELTPQPTRWSSNGRAMGPTVFDIRKSDPLEQVRRDLRARPPLTLEELSWPDEEQLSGPEGGAYRSSAQLFVTELLRLKDGAACLRGMIAELPQCYNWQTAFLRAFHAHFERLLDLEKWWALQVVNLTGRDPSQTWTRQESWIKLDEILRIPVQIRRSAGELPERSEVTLQTVVSEWDRQRQIQTFRDRLLDLNLARLHISQELVGLVDDYRQVLGDYLEKRVKIGMELPPARPGVPMLRTLMRETLSRLDTLDARRQALRPEPVAASSAKVLTDHPVTP